MQPVRIGVSAAVVLVLLLVSVPLQLFLTNVFTTSSASSSPGDRDGNGDDVTDSRAKAVDRLVITAESLSSSLYSTLSYYSSWSNLKELVLVPYRKLPSSKLKTTVFKAKDGSTTILLSSGEGGKTSKASKTGSPGTQGSNNAQGKAGQTRMGSSEARKPGSSTKQQPSNEEVSQAKEVDDYLMKEVYFSQSKTTRSRRPRSVRFSVGQVVRHKTAEYVGVITGWDEMARAPDRWIKRYYKERKGVELTPHYLLLLDSRYSSSGSPYHYVPQEDIEPAPGEQIRCSERKRYFESFKNGRYIPKPWLRNRYPRD